MTIRHIVENPYFTCLTDKLISDSLNGVDNEDFFVTVRKWVKS